MTLVSKVVDLQHDAIIIYHAQLKFCGFELGDTAMKLKLYDVFLRCDTIMEKS